jgi:SAM-dependent methyltransferase
VEQLPGKYDVVVMNSVMQYFADQEYACAVLKACRRMLKNGGVLFCGDVMDENKRGELEAFIASRASERKMNNLNNMLFYTKSFFTDSAAGAGFSRCDVSDKIFILPNELSLFRFDALFHVDGAIPESKPAGNTACMTK